MIARGVENARCLVPVALVVVLVVAQGGFRPGFTCLIGAIGAAAYTACALYALITRGGRGAFADCGTGSMCGAPAVSVPSTLRAATVPLAASAVSSDGGSPDAAKAGGRLADPFRNLGFLGHRGRFRRVPGQSCWLLAISLVFLASTAAHGATATMWLETASWFAVAGMSLWCVFDTAADKHRALCALGVAGVLLSAFGILVFAGIVEAEGVVSAGRLMFTFQYANAAAAFFAVSTLLCMLELPGPWRCLAAFPFVALALTRSVGVLLTFACASLVEIVLKLRLQRGTNAGVGAGAARIPVSARALIGMVALVGAVAAAGGRLPEAWQTFVERVVQLLDATALLAKNLPLGIGPDQWQLYFPLVESAQYRCAVVHCSYMQVALDAGVFALIGVAGMVVFGLARLVRAGDATSAVCVGMIGVHAIVDFDFQFAALLLLVALLSAIPGEAGASNIHAMGTSSASVAKGMGVRSRFGRMLDGGAGLVPFPFAAVAVAMCMALSAYGVWYGSLADEVGRAYAQPDASRMEQIVGQHSALERDLVLKSQVAGAYFAAGEWESAVRTTDGATLLGEGAVLYRVFSLRALGRDGEACETMADSLRDRLYDIELFGAFGRYIEQSGAGGDFVAAYNDAAELANAALERGHAPWLSNQSRISLL